jgi:hypothetical protein
MGGVFTVDGYSVTSGYRLRRKNNPSSLFLAIYADFNASVLIRRETSADGFLKKVGLNVEIQTNDPVFDREFYIECNDPLFVSDFTGAPEVKQALRNLFVQFDYVVVQGNCCKVVQSPAPDMTAVVPGILEQAARAMIVLVRHLPSVTGSSVSATPLTDEFNRSYRFFLWTSAATLAAGFVAVILMRMYEPLEKMRLFQASLLISGPLMLMFVMYAFNELKGRAASAKVFIPVALLVAAGFVLLGWSGAAVLNGLLDVSAPVAHQATVGAKYVNRGKTITYRVMIIGWNNQSDGFSFPVSSAAYSGISAGDPCVITTRSGLLGFEWVAEKHCGRV